MAVAALGGAGWPQRTSPRSWPDSSGTIAYSPERPWSGTGSGLWRIWFSPAEIEDEAHYWPLALHDLLAESTSCGGVRPGRLPRRSTCCCTSPTPCCCGGCWRGPARWVVAAVFAVHPLHVESVAWVMERKDVLSGLFYLVAFWAWIRFVEERRPKLRRRATFLALASFVLGAAVEVDRRHLAGGPRHLALVEAGRASPAPTCAGWRRFFAVGLAFAVADVAFSNARGAHFPRLLDDRAGAHRGARALVLRRQAAVAGGPGRHLPALGGERDGPAGSGGYVAAAVALAAGALAASAPGSAAGRWPACCSSR